MKAIREAAPGLGVSAERAAAYVDLLERGPNRPPDVPGDEEILRALASGRTGDLIDWLFDAGLLVFLPEDLETAIARRMEDHAAGRPPPQVKAHDSPVLRKGEAEIASHLGRVEQLARERGVDPKVAAAYVDLLERSPHRPEVLPSDAEIIEALEQNHRPHLVRWLFDAGRVVIVPGDLDLILERHVEDMAAGRTARTRMAPDAPPPEAAPEQEIQAHLERMEALAGPEGVDPRRAAAYVDLLERAPQRLAVLPADEDILRALRKGDSSLLIRWLFDSGMMVFLPDDLNAVVDRRVKDISDGRRPRGVSAGEEPAPKPEEEAILAHLALLEPLARERGVDPARAIAYAELLERAPHRSDSLPSDDALLTALARGDTSVLIRWMFEGGYEVFLASDLEEELQKQMQFIADGRRVKSPEEEAANAQAEETRQQLHLEKVERLAGERGLDPARARAYVELLEHRPNAKYSLPRDADILDALASGDSVTLLKWLVAAGHPLFVPEDLEKALGERVGPRRSDPTETVDWR